MKTFLVILMLIFFGCKNSKSIRVHYYSMPLDIETYIAITHQNIEEHSLKEGSFYLDDATYKKILTLRKNTNCTFDKYKVRAKFVFNKEIVFLDQKGNLKYDNFIICSKSSIAVYFKNKIY